MMDDDTIRAKAKAAKLPKIMWDTVGFRERLAAFVEAELAAERERLAKVFEGVYACCCEDTYSGGDIASVIRSCSP
jgi:hypothetical protein